MTGFLSVLHGRTRVWDCQVLHNGRWKTGAAAFLGDEQKQVFSKLSRYGSVTKHMSPASRRDHITEAIFYNNEEKEEGMSVNLTKNYSIIDKWMLSKRWEEEIVQTRREMIAFVTYFKDLHAKLTEDLAVQGIIVQSYTSGQKSRSNSGQTTPSWL
ncbi:hypothetical protein OUZ56_009571 [Daphnia magna]|uniref:Uncharacterized protein n=1 Tax=Daphnia magna TaxID=35525 RepID=A0ABR0AGE0_9CRUS|nr:hypothetical protein OUZ56_009571 [Daphnia magna]